MRTERMFGSQYNEQGGKGVRTIRLRRGKAKIGLMSLAYKLRRLSYPLRRARGGLAPV